MIFICLHVLHSNVYLGTNTNVQIYCGENDCIQSTIYSSMTWSQLNYIVSEPNNSRFISECNPSYYEDSCNNFTILFTNVNAECVYTHITLALCDFLTVSPTAAPSMSPSSAPTRAPVSALDYLKMLEIQ